MCSGHESFDEYDLPPALPIMGMLDHSQDGKYAPGSQKSRVSGEVLRWHHENGTESVPASEYIEKLESEIRILKQQVRCWPFWACHSSCICLSSFVCCI